jgi:hypothetical protein
MSQTLLSISVRQGDKKNEGIPEPRRRIHIGGVNLVGKYLVNSVARIP